jgi:deoxyribodipyrimidine photo-lyase
MGLKVSTAVMVFTQDLRIHDHPALSAAAGSGRVLPAYVLDDTPASVEAANPTQLPFLAASLRDLDDSLRGLGAALVVRAGHWVAEVLRLAGEVAADQIHVTDPVEPLYRQHLDLLTAEAITQRVQVLRHPGRSVVPAGRVTPAGGGEYKVFGAYHRAWLATPWRAVLPPPKVIVLPDDRYRQPWPATQVERIGGQPAGGRARPIVPGGETAGRQRLDAWTQRHLSSYSTRRDELTGEATSRLSPYLHFGCLSARQVAAGVLPLPCGGEFARQLCWRDFFYQVLAARPDAASADYRDRGAGWRSDPELVAAWREGHTGYPLVDAGMRQLTLEGFLPNRVRMAVASFLTRDLDCDWRIGAEHFRSLLLDADLALNQLNWQWVAGTGTDPNRHRVFNPTRQGQRFDPEGRYVRRYLPELADLPNSDVQDPDPESRRSRGYPEPIVDHAVAVASYRARQRPANASRPGARKSSR